MEGIISCFDGLKDFRRLDPEAFRACFVTFVRRFAEVAKGMVAVEGKTLRHITRSIRPAGFRRCIW